MKTSKMRKSDGIYRISDKKKTTLSNDYYFPFCVDATSVAWTETFFRGVIGGTIGLYIWSDGHYIYYSNDKKQYRLQPDNNWQVVRWTGLTEFNGNNVWSDGIDIFYSSESKQYKLNGTTWEPMIWMGLASFDGNKIWTDGNDIYYSYATLQYILEGTEWIPINWTGLDNISNYLVGTQIWTDGFDIFFSYGEDQFKLNGRTWVPTTWTGLTYFSGLYVWSDGVDIYYSQGTTQYKLSKTTWSAVTWAGLTDFDGPNIWNDGESFYYSFGTTQYTHAFGKTKYNTTWSNIKAKLKSYFDGIYAKIASLATVATTGSYNDLVDKPTVYEKGLYFGTCTGCAANQIKTVTIPSEQGFDLVVGSTVYVKFDATNTYTATAEAPVKLNVNNTGNINVYAGANPAVTGTSTTYFGRANYVNQYMYDGTYWVWQGSSADNNTTYSAMSTSELTTGTVTTARSVRSDYLKAGINSLIDTKIGALDVAGASGIDANKTIKAWSETDGKVSVETQDISITKSQVSDFPGVVSTSANGLAPKVTSTSKFLRGDGTWATPTDTKNTAGSTNTSSKIFLVGATNQAANPQTYSDDEIYATNGVLTARKLSTKGILALTGTGTAGQDKGSGSTNRYVPALWTFNANPPVADGEVYFIKIPVAGGSYGVWLSLDNGTTYYPVAVSNGKARFQSHSPINSVIAVSYESAGVCTCYAMGGADSGTDVTGCFRVVDSYDSGNTTYSAMSSSELTTGTATTLRTVRADYLKTGINSLINAKLSSLHIGNEYSYRSTSTYSDGYWVIRIKSSSNWMLCFTVTLYQDYKATKLMISGYNYGDRHWYEPKVVLLGTTMPINSMFGVDFGYLSMPSSDDRFIAIPRANYTGILIDQIANGYQLAEYTDDLFEIMSVESSTYNAGLSTNPYKKQFTGIKPTTINIKRDEELYLGEMWLGTSCYHRYRKYINFGSLPNGTTKSVAHNISNVVMWVSLTGIFWSGSTQTSGYALPWITTSNGSLVYANMYITAANVSIQTTQNLSSYYGTITVEYIKAS